MREHSRGILLIVAAALLWSTGGIGIKAVSDGPLKVTFYRSLIAAAALAVYFRPRLTKLTAPFVVAIISYAACLTTFVVATKWTTAANAIFLQYAGVIWVLLLSPLVLREPLSRRDVIAICAAVLGMALFFLHEFDPRGIRGNLMAVVSSLFFAILVMSLRRERGRGAEAAVTYGNVFTAAVLFPFVSGDLRLSGTSAAVLGFLGLFQVALGYICFVRGLEHVPATQASLTGMLEPIANPIWVFLFIGEKPHVLALAGGAIVLAAVAWRTVTGPPAIVPPPD